MSKRWMYIGLFLGVCSFANTPAVIAESIDTKVKSAEIQVLEAGKAEEARELLWQAIDKFWTTFAQEDFNSLYNMYSQEYRDKVTLTSFLKRKRFLVTGYSIKTVSFWGDQCAQVRYYINANNEGMILKNLLLKHYWVFRDGSWSIYESPQRINPMFAQAKKDTQAPCVLPAKPKEK